MSSTSTDTNTYIYYNDKFTLPAIGFNNMGATCYWNAIYQSLLSCTSFIETVSFMHKNNVLGDVNISQVAKAEGENTISLTDDQIKTLLKKNIIKNFFSTIEKLLVGNQIDISNISSECWKQLYLSTTRRKDRIMFNMSQQCASEGLMMLFDLFDNDKYIKNIFSHQYKHQILCNECKFVNKNMTVDECMIFDISAKNEEKQDLKAMLMKSIEKISDYKCPKCNSKNDKLKKTELCVIPEILIILVKRYEVVGNNVQKTSSDVVFPLTLSFEGISNNMVYEPVAQVEHIGIQSSGHYYAICKRKEGWCKLDDRVVSKVERFEPTENTFIVFYHLVRS
jgi:ubiquitin C-terminal hydrolase